MPSIIEKLYNDVFFHSKPRYIRDPEYIRVTKLTQTTSENLMHLLDDKGKDLFEKYQVADCELQTITDYENFASGIKFGIILMAEAFAGMDDLAG